MYLDYCATTPIKDEILDAMLPYFKQYGNPSSLYGISTKIKQNIEDVREQIKNYIGSNKGDKIIFTSGGSESNNLAIKGYCFKKENKCNHIITSTIEHHSVLNCCKFLNDNGYKINYVNVNNNGELKYEELNSIIDDKSLVSIQHVNNEIGTIQDIYKISNIIHSNNSILHIDATQSFPNIKPNVNNIDMLTMSGHKIGTPKGIGILYIKDEIKLEPLIHGGKQEYGLRGGTENVPYIIGLGKAIEILDKDLNNKNKIIEDLYDYFIEKLFNNIDNIVLNGDANNRIKSNINIQIKGVESESLLYLLDFNNIYISTGSACNQGNTENSHVLKAINNDNSESIRISFDEHLTKDNIDKIVEILKQCVNSIRNR